MQIKTKKVIIILIPEDIKFETNQFPANVGIVDKEDDYSSMGWWIILDVDNLFTNNTPHTNFWMWCLLNDLVTPHETLKGKYQHNIWYADLVLSEDNSLNEKTFAFLEKLEINLGAQRKKDGTLVSR